MVRPLDRGRLCDLTVGQLDQLLRKLTAGGLDRELAEALLYTPGLTERWVAELHELDKSRKQKTRELFRPSGQIYHAFLARAHRMHWPFTQTQLNTLHAAEPRDFPSRVGSALALDIWLGDAQTTFEALWAWNVDVHPVAERWPHLKTDALHMRLAHPKRYGSESSVRWVELDLTANVDHTAGTTALDVSRSENAAGLQLLAAAALHPEWVRAFEYDNVPPVRLPGIIVTDDWLGKQQVLTLSWGKTYGDLGLHEMPADCAHLFYAQPTFKDVARKDAKDAVPVACG